MQLDEQKILDAKGATGIGTPMYVGDVQNIVIAFHTASSTNATTKLKGSISKGRPTFGSAQSPTNSWEFIEVIDLEDGSAIDGNTGIVQSGTDFNRYYKVNVDALTWIVLDVTTYSAGAITAIAKGYNFNKE